MRARLTVNLSAIVSNYSLLQNMLIPGCKAAAVVKADGYGLGAAPIAKALSEQTGIDTFYVATLDEAVALREATSKRIGVLGGVGEGEESTFVAHALTPVLNSPAQMERWAKVEGGDAILHIDTGMNRLGLTAAEARGLLDNPDQLKAARIGMLMSHFTSSEVPDDSMTMLQGTRMALYKSATGLPVSLCNSSGIFCDRALSLQHEQVRPGAALYGINPWPVAANPMATVVKLEAPIIQIKTAVKGETAGYNCTEVLARESRLAIVGYGYADGLLRSGSGKVHLNWRDIPCKVMGRVSMDFLIVDVTDIPQSRLHEESHMAILDKWQTADDLAEICQTNAYEILTQSRASRAERIYL